MSKIKDITMREQQNNRRNNRIVTYKGRSYTMSDFARKYHIKYSRLQGRLKGEKVSEELLKELLENAE